MGGPLSSRSSPSRAWTRLWDCHLCGHILPPSPPSTCSTSLDSSWPRAPGLGVTLQPADPWADAMPCQSLFPLGSFPAVCMWSLPRRYEEEGREQAPTAFSSPWVPPVLFSSQAPAVPPRAVTCCLLTPPSMCLLLCFPCLAALVSGSTHALPPVRGRVPAVCLRGLKGKLKGENSCRPHSLPCLHSLERDGLRSGPISLQGCH